MTREIDLMTTKLHWFHKVFREVLLYNTCTVLQLNTQTTTKSEIILYYPQIHEHAYNTDIRVCITGKDSTDNWHAMIWHSKGWIHEAHLAKFGLDYHDNEHCRDKKCADSAKYAS